MLALRTTVYSDRWTQDWQVVQDSWHQVRFQRFEAHRPQAVEKTTIRLQQTFWCFPLSVLLACFPSPAPQPHQPRKDGLRDKSVGGDKAFLRELFSMDATSKDEIAKNGAHPGRLIMIFGRFSRSETMPNPLVAR